MTEKQFTFEFDGGAWGVPVFYNNNKKLSFDEVVQLLNKLNDENEQLKSDVQMCREKALYWRNKAEDIFGDMKTNIELKQENRQLKQLAEGNEESLLTVMTYLHDNHYDIWEKVNKECFND